MNHHITTPITEEVTGKLKSGDYVYITGTIYVARDAAHKRMMDFQSISRMPQSIIWDRLRQEREDQLVRQDLQLRPEWTSMRRRFLILEKRQ